MGLGSVLEVATLLEDLEYPLPPRPLPRPLLAYVGALMFGFKQGQDLQ
jgi:hypothetical protein